MKKKRHRSAITGKFVTQKEVLEHPESTVTETVQEPVVVDTVNNPFDGSDKEEVKP